jgi:hypothetical protein
MKVLSGCRYLLIAAAAVAGVGCSSPEPHRTPEEALKLASAKCAQGEAPLGSLIKKGCNNSGDARQVDTREFMEALQVPGTVPQK